MKSLIERFNEKYIPVTESGCWIWMANTCKAGYGKIYTKGKDELAHRVSYAISNGEIPKGLHVLHRCDIPSCVNPAHLFLGTHEDNMQDKAKKGRAVGFNQHGVKNNNARLNENQVKEIIASTEKQKDIASKYGVSTRAIRKIKRGDLWPEVFAKCQTN